MKGEGMYVDQFSHRRNQIVELFTALFNALYPSVSNTEEETLAFGIQKQKKFIQITILVPSR